MNKAKSKISLEEQIIRKLQHDSTLSYRQLAKELQSSPATISSKIKQMEDQGVIKKYTLQVDFEKLGYDLTVLINCRVAKGKLFTIEEQIAQLDDVVAVYDVTGEYDIVVIAKCKDREAISILAKKLLENKNIERTNTQVALNVIKEDFNLPPISIQEG